VAINFPTSLDNFTNPSSGNTLDSPSHSLQHSDINDAVEALEAKVGIGASPAGSATSGQVLTAQGGGTALWATPTASGLVKIVPSSVAVGSGTGSVSTTGLVTFSGVSSLSLNDVFSSTYDHYKILLNCSGSTFNTGTIRMRVAGADASSADYDRMGQYQISLNNVWQGYTSAENTTSWQLFSYGTLGLQQNIYEIANPFTANRTTMNGISQEPGGSLVSYYSNGAFDETTSFTGISFLAASATTFSGTLLIYGYN
jgi:hypothetical protein